MKTRKLLTLSFLFIAVLTTAIFVFNQTDVLASGGDCETRECRKDLAKARAATAKYHDINVAIAEGFVPVTPCVSLPTGEAMGFHYANFSRIFDSNLDPSEPELLLYLPDENGEMKLVAIEYFAPYTGSNPPPVLFGKTFDGPENDPFPHYELHVWAWRNNPNGMFAPFNPQLRCPAN